MARNRHDDDDEDYDDRPRKKKRRRDDDDDDDYDGSSGGSGSGAIIAIVAVVGALVVGGIVAGALLWTRAEKRVDAEVAEAQPAPQLQFPGDPQAKGMFPKVNPGDPLQPTKKNEETPAKLATGVVAVPPLNPSVTQVVFGGGENGFAAIISNKQMGVGSRIDIVKTATGAAQGQVLTDSVSNNGFAVSPDGKYLAVIGSAPFEGNPVSLYTVADGNSLTKFTPYSKVGAITNPELVWVAFPIKDQLLTINSAGGFDLWSVPDMKRTGGIAATLKAGSRIDVNGFTHSPSNFSVTNDGKTLAIFNGGGFTFYDLATANETARTEDVMKVGGSALFNGAAFSADGTRFACFYQTFGTGAVTMLQVWDAKSGQKLSATPIGKGVQSPAGLAWWGTTNLLFWEGGIASARIFSLTTGQVIGTVKTSIPGRFSTVPPNGQIWGVVGGSGYDPKSGAAYLVRADGSPGPVPGVRFELSPEGLKPK